MFHLNDNVRRPWKLASAWFNKVAAFLNNICGDGVITISRPDLPSPDRPVSFGLNFQGVRDKLLPMLDFRTIPFTLKAVQNADGSVSSLVVFMPSTTIKYGGSDYTMKSGVATATLPTGWYVVTGITTGDVYVNQATNKDSTEWEFGTGLPSGTGMWGVKIGSVASDGTVTQYPLSMRGDSIVKDDAEVSREVGTKAKINETEGTTSSSGDSSFDASEVPLSPSSSFDPKDSTSKWDIGDKDTTVTPNVEVGVRFRVITRSLYDSNDGITYMYYRELSFSKAGILVKVGAESRIAVLA